MSAKHLTITTVFIALLLLIVPPISYSQNSDEFQCPTASGYGTETDQDTYELDLQCQPVFPFTFELSPDEEITVVIKLENYFEANDTDEADFSLHFAMQRANISIKEPGSINSETIVDSDGRIQDVNIRSDQNSFEFILTNDGFRSAIFDFSVRPD